MMSTPMDSYPVAQPNHAYPVAQPNRAYPSNAHPVPSKDTAKKELMDYEFALRDIGLYLDTHPSDANALAEYNRLVKKRDTALKAYEAHYGPLTVGGCEVSGGRWSWIDSPWPWEGGRD